MTKTQQNRRLFSKSAWSIARFYGCHYSGDYSPVPHGGFFYDARNWEEYGYCSCVYFWFDYDNCLQVVECGTINKPYRAEDMERAWQCIGIDKDSPERDNIHAQIAACESYMGHERDDMSVKQFAPDADDCFDEDAIMNDVKGWIRALGK